MAVENATGEKTFVASAAVTAHCRVKIDTSKEISHAGAGEIGIGIAAKDISSDSPGMVKLWSKAGTVKMTAAGAFSIGDTLYPAASGRVDDVDTGAPIGKAMEAATAAGDIVEVLPLVSAGAGAPPKGVAGEALCADDLVYVSGMCGEFPIVKKAQGTSAGLFAQYIAPTAAASAGDVALATDYVGTAKNTNAGTVGDPVYLSDGTAGGWTLTKPTGTDKVQEVGRIAVKSATVGQIAFHLYGANIQIVHDHSDNSEGGQLGGEALETAADADVYGNMPVIFRKASSAAGNTTIAVLSRKIRVIDWWIVCTGATAGDVTLKNGNADTIGATIAHGNTDDAIVRGAKIDDAYHEVASACSLVLVQTCASETIIYVAGLPVA